MDDLISRQAAIEALGDMPMSWADTDAEIQAQEDWKQHREALLKLPTANPSVVTMKLDVDKESLKKAMEEAELTLVTEPRKGKWEIDVDCEYDIFDIAGEGTWAVKATCSECGFAMRFIEGHGMFNYCQNCGARMEE